MNVKEGVSSFELSMKLKELRAIQKSLWWWVSVRRGKPELYYEKILGILECNSPYAYKRICSAFTVAESGERLPIHYATRRVEDNKWICYESAKCFLEEADTEANVKAKMRIYLLENRIIKEE